MRKHCVSGFPSPHGSLSPRCPARRCSPEELQAMVDIVAIYKWQYQLNADKSSVIVLAKTRLSAHSSRKWYIG